MEVDWIDAAVLTKELTNIYSTPTPKGWPEPKKVNDLYIGLIVCPHYNSRGFIFIPWADKSPKRTRLDNKKKYSYMDSNFPYVESLLMKLPCLIRVPVSFILICT